MSDGKLDRFVWEDGDIEITPPKQQDDDKKDDANGSPDSDGGGSK